MHGSPGRAEAAQHLGQGGARGADHGCAGVVAHGCVGVAANVSIHSHALEAVWMGPQDQCSVGKGEVIGSCVRDAKPRNSIASTMRWRSSCGPNSGLGSACDDPPAAA